MHTLRASLSSLLLSLFTIISYSQQTARTVTDLSNNNWKLWLDTKATWVNDILYPPPVDIKKLTVHLPTGGWDALDKAAGRTVHLPATVEQYQWGLNQNTFGVAGNYLGVSWWTTSFPVPVIAKGKRIVLRFDAVRFRAEIFVNRQLVGYDLVNSTPFEIDITDYIKYGTTNQLVIRITDPNGNFDWRDSQNFMWGNYRTNPTHGFGGITGKVKLVTTDKVFISDIFIKNKSTPTEIDVQISTGNLSGKPVSGSFLLRVKEAKTNGKTVFEKTYSVEDLSESHAFTIAVPNAKLWSVDSPHLYYFTAEWKGNDKTTDTYTQRFGFRWFEVRDVAGDKQFYLNNKRIVLLTAISWGFWPVNGIAPSDELARKQVEAAKAFFISKNREVINILLTGSIQQIH
jgi:beta-galactosidase